MPFQAKDDLGRTYNLARGRKPNMKTPSEAGIPDDDEVVDDTMTHAAGSTPLYRCA